MLARPLYRFKWFDLGAIPRAKRKQALDLEIVRWAPYAESGHVVAWLDEGALVWCWDAARLRPALAEFRLNPKRVRVIPESLLSLPHADGIRLVHCMEGYEGQIWSAGLLKHSRWWPQPPAASDWLMFQRSAGVQPEAQIQQVPPAAPSQLQRRPWIKSSGNGGAGLGWPAEKLIVGLCTVLLALPTLWYGLGLYKLHQAEKARVAQLADLQREARPILQARSQALEGWARIRELQGLNPYPDPLFLMAKIAEVLPKNDAALREWQFSDGKLKIIIAAPSPLSSSFLVNALQLAGPFDKVKATAGSDAKIVTLEMEVKKL